MKLIFVYNAEEGLFNALSDTIHKVFSPATYDCRLCYFTHGLLGMLRGWKQFLESLGCSLAFYHRPDFRREYQRHDIALPAILAETDGTLNLLITADEINACQELDELMSLVTSALERQKCAAYVT